MSQDQLPPQLDDFETQLKSINTNKKIKQNQKHFNQQDYTKLNTRHIQDEQKFKIEKQELKGKQAVVYKELQKNIKKQQYGGLKKGFFSGGSKPSKTCQNKKQKIPQIKASKNNPLEIKEVQQAMKMNNYLDETRKQWMTQNFLNNVEGNNKINKLFTNPEYMKAIQMFKTNPREAMVRYGNNKEFMEGFQQFCKMMGMQFQNLSNKSKASK